MECYGLQAQNLAEVIFQDQRFEAGGGVRRSCNRTYGRHSNSLDVDKKVVSHPVLAL